MKALEKKSQGILSPSILAADFSQLGAEIADVEKHVDWIHLDVMDGHFVPNLTLGPGIVKSLRKLTTLPFDCHLMVTDPENWIDPFADAGADILTVHVETTPEKLPAILKKIRDRGCHPGITLNPATPAKALAPYLDWVDLVLVMSVNPGFTGQKFMESSLQKTAEIAAMRGQRKFLIEVDGGISKTNIGSIRKAGADAFVAGASIFFSKDRLASIKELRQEIVAGGN